METTATIRPVAEQTRPKTGGKVQTGALWVLTALLWFILCRHLSSEWSINEQYSYGWFVPFFAAYLFWLRLEDRPRSRPEVSSQESETRSQTLESSFPTNDRSPKSFGFRPQTFDLRSLTSGFLLSTFYFLLLAALLPIRLFELGNQDWRLLSWLHAIATVGITLVGIIWIGGRPWLRHFSFPVLFFLVAVPWVTPIEEPIVQGLMTLVATVATEAVTLFGIPATVEGNVIRLGSGLVGVNEACSGVRSLQTSLMIGLLFGELRRLSLAKRIVLVVGAVALALLANFTRAFLLVWLSATRGAASANQWHDWLGYSIVGVVFVGTILLASALGKKNSADPKIATPRLSSDRFPFSRFSIPTACVVLTLSWLLLVEAGTRGWYFSHERNLANRQGWSVRWPNERPKYREIEITSEVRTMLRYDEGREAIWWQPEGAGMAPTQVSLFFFRWKPGGDTALRARSHRPDVCLPSIGWKKAADRGVRSYRITDQLVLPFRHFSFVRELPGQPPLFAEAFFCVREDRVRPNDASSDFLTADVPVSDWSRTERLRVVMEGLRNTGQQVLELTFFSTAQLEAAQAQEKFGRALPELIVTNP